MKRTLQLFGFAALAVLSTFSVLAQSSVSNLRIDNANPCFGDDVVITATFALDPSLTTATVDFNINGFDTTVTGVGAGDRNFLIPSSRIAVGSNLFMVDTVGTTPQTASNTLAFEGREQIDLDFTVSPDNDICTGEDIVINFSNISGGDTLHVFLNLNGDSIPSSFTVIPNGAGQKLSDTIYAALVASTPMSQDIVIVEIRDNAGCSVMPVGKSQTVNIFPNPKAVFGVVSDTNRLGNICDNDASIEIPVMFSDAQNNAIAYVTFTQGATTTTLQTTGPLVTTGAGTFMGKIVLNGLTAAGIVDNLSLTIDSVRSGTGSQLCTYVYPAPGAVNFDLHQSPDAILNLSVTPICAGTNDTLTITEDAGSSAGMVAYYTSQIGTFNVSVIGEYVNSFNETQEFLLDSVVNDFCIANYNKETRGTLTVNDRPSVDVATFASVCVGQSANFDFEITGTPDTYYLKYSISGPAGSGDSIYSGLSAGSNNIAFNAPLTVPSVGTYTVIIDSLANESTLCSAVVSDIEVNSVATNTFTFEVTDTVSATVLFNGGSTAYICSPAVNGASANVDSVEVRFYVSELPVGVSNLNFTFNFYNDGVISNGQILNAPTANFVADGSVATFTHYYSFNVLQPQDSLNIELTQLSFLDAGGNTCTSNFDGSAPFIAASKSRLAPQFAVTNGSKVFDCVSFDNIVYDFTVANIDEVDFSIEDITDPLTPVLVGNGTITSLAGETAFDTTFSELVTILGSAVVQDVNYRVTFTNTRQLADANFTTDCNYSVTNNNVFEAYLVPTPNLVSVSADPTTICDDSTATLTLVTSGNLPTSFDLIKTTIGGVVSNNRFNYNPTATYNAGLNETTFKLSLIPDSTATYEIDSLFVTYNGEVCKAEVSAPNTATVTVEQTISAVSISSNKSVICDNGSVNLTVVTTGGDASYTYGIETTTQSGSIDTIYYTNASSPISLVLNETSTFKIIELKNGSGNLCPSSATDAVNVEVRSNATAEIISGDSTFCAGTVSGATLKIVAFGTANLTFDVQNVATAAALPQFTTNHVMVSDTDTVYIELPLMAGEDLMYTLVSISDDSNPVCNVGPLSSSVNIAMNISPLAEIAVLPNFVCFNGEGSIRLNFAGGSAGNNTNISYALRYKNGNDITATPNPRLNQDTSLANGIPFIAANFSGLAQDTIFEVYNVTDAFGCISPNVFSAPVMVRNQVDVTDVRAAFDTVCDASKPSFIVDFNQSNTDFDVYYNGLNTPVTTQSGDTIQFTAFAGTTFVLTVDSVAYATTSCYVSVNLKDSAYVSNQASINIVNAGPITSCFGDDVKIAFNSLTGDDLVSAVLTDGNGNSYNFTMVAGTQDTLVLSGLASGTYNFAITSASYNTNEGICSAGFNPTISQPVTVGNEIVASISALDLTVCEDDNIPFTISLAPGNTNFNYNLKYVVGTDTSIQLITSSPQTFNLTLSASATIDFIELAEVGGLNCASELNQSFNVTVGERPSVLLSSTSTICEEETTNLELSFEGTAPYTIRISNIGTFEFFDAAGTGDTLLAVSPNVTTTYTVLELTDASASGCANALLAPAPTTTINVVAKPTVSLIVSNDSICKGDVVNLDFRVTNVVSNINNQVVLSYRGVGGNIQTITLDEDALNPNEYIKSVSSSPTTDVTYSISTVKEGSSPSCTFAYTNINIPVVVYNNLSSTISSTSVDVCDNESVNITVAMNGRGGEQVTFTLRDELGNDSTVTVPTNSQTVFTINNITTDKVYTIVNAFYVDLPTCVLSTTPSISINHNEVANANVTFVQNACAGESFEFELNITSGEGDVTVGFLTDKLDNFSFTGTVAGSPYRIPYTYNSADSLKIRIASISSSVAKVCNNTAFTPDTVALRVFPIPSAEITTDRPTIVAGASANLLFVVKGDTVGSPENIRVEYAANGVGGNFVEDNGSVPGFVTANNAATPTHDENVTPATTTNYSIVNVTQGACISTAVDDVTVNVVSGKAIAISGSANLCTSDSLPVTFSIANGDTYFIRVRVTELNSGNDYEYVFPNPVADGDELNIPNQANPALLPFKGPLEVVLVNASKANGTVTVTLNETDVPNPFAGKANFNIQEVKTVAMVSDTTGCFGQSLPVVFEIEGTGEFNISFKSVGNGNVNRSFTASENDSPVTIQINPSELDLGEHNFIFGVLPTNSLSNSCPIDTSGSGRIYVQPSLTSSIDFSPLTACAGQPVDVSFSVAPDSLVNVSYRVDSNSVSTFDTIFGIQGNNVVIDNFIPNGNVTYTILNVEYNNAPSCPNPTVQSKTLKVVPQPTAKYVDVVSDTNICFGDVADLRVQFSSPNYPISYTLTDSSTITRNLTFYNSTGTNDTIIKVMPTSTSRFYLKNVTQVAAPSCSNIGFDIIDVIVGKELTLNDYRLSRDTICQGDALNILVDVDGTPNIIARFSDGVSTFIRTLPTTTGFNIVPINPSPQVDRIYTLIDLTDGSDLACTATFNVADTVVVRLKPSISISPDRSIICLGDSVRIRVTVNAEDTVSFRLSDQLDNFTRIYSDVDPGTQFYNITPNILGNNTFSVDSLYYQDGLSCKVFNPISFNVKTNEIPSASIFVGNSLKDTVVCEGFPVNLKFDVSGTGVRTVYFANDRGFSSSFTVGSSEFSKNLSINPFPESGLIKYYITRVVSNDGAICESMPMDTVRVTVNPTPTVEITANKNPRCLNDATPTTITFNFNGAGPFEFDYTDGENLFTLTANSDSDGDTRFDKTIVVAPGKTTTYNVTRIKDVTVPNNCVNNGGNAFTLVVNQPTEAEVFNANNVICSGESVNIVYSVRGKAPISVLFRISDGLGYVRDTLIQGLSTGVYNYTFNDTVRTATNSNYTVNIVEALDGNIPQCSAAGIGVARVTVNAVPRIANFNTVLDTICAGDAVDLNFDIVNGFGNYAVVYSANGVAKNDTILGLASGGGPATIVLTPNNTTRYRRISITDLLTGCTRTYNGTIPQDTVVVLRNPIVTVTADANTYCSDSQAAITVTVTGDSIPNGIFLDNIFLNGVAIPGAPFAIDDTQSGNPAYFKIIPVNLPAGTPENSQITFGTVVDGNNLSNPSRIGGCDTDVKDTINIIVNPIATATIVNPFSETICESDTADIIVKLVGNGTITTRLAIIDGTDTLASVVFNGTEATSPITYSTSDYNLVGKSIRYSIDTVYSISNGVACGGNAGVPSSKTFVIKGNPKVTISPMDTTICQGDDLLVRFDITPVGAGNGPYDFYYVFNNDTTEFFNVGSSSIDIITPADSGVLYVPYVTNRSTPICFSNDSVGITINVNPKANAVFADLAPLTYCEDDQAGFNLTLSGQGIVTAIYRNVNTGVLDSVKNFAGTYFVPVNQATNTTALYQIIAVNDQSNPRCIENNFTSSATITVYPRPQAVLSGEFTTCEGGVSTVGINLTGSNADSIIVYFSDKLNGTIDTSFSARVGVYSMVLAPSDTAFFTIDSIAYVNFGCTVSDPLLINQDTAKIYVRPLPEATIVVPSIESCNGQDIVFDVQFAYDGPYDFSYRINNNPEQNASNVDGNFLITVPAAGDTTQLRVTSLVYRDIPQCSSENVDSLIVNVNDSLDVTVLDTLCNSTATGFQFNLDIKGGQESSYSFNGTDPLAAMGYTPLISNGAYSFNVQDNSGCPAVVLSGDYTCECISFAGTFSIPNPALEYCEDDTADVTPNYIGGAVKDANDTMLFILHDSPNGTLGNVFATDSVPRFAYKNNILFNTVYYISALVGDSISGAAFDGSDRCLSVSEGVPVVFRKRSTVTIELILNDSGEVCRQNKLNYRFVFEGTGPYVVTWNDGVTTQTKTFVSNITPPLESEANATANGVFTISSFVDNGNAYPCNTILNSPLPYIARQLPDPVYDVSDDKPCGFEVVNFSIRNPNATTAYSWNIDGEPFNGNPVTYAFDTNGPAIATSYATSAFGCIDSSTRIINVNLPVVPTISYVGNSVASRVCRNDALVFTANVVIGTNSDQVRWFLNGALVQSSSTLNTYAPAAFTNKGIYTLVAENIFQGCNNRDTLVFEVQGPGADVVFDDEFCVDEDVLFGLTNTSDVSGVEWTLTGASSIVRNSANFSIALAEGFPSNDVVTVALKLSSAAGCVYDTLFDVTVHDLDVQLDNFNGFGDLQRHCLGFEDEFRSTATTINSLVSWNYDFGDGNTSSLNTPDPVTNNYAAPGLYKASVTLTDEFGCVDTDTLNMEILALPVVEALDTFACLSEVLIVEATGATTYSWTSNPVGAFANDPITGAQQQVQTNIPGSYDVTVTGTDDEGCMNTDDITINVYDLESPLIRQNYRALFDTSYKIGYVLPLNYDLGDVRYIYDWTPGIDITCVDCPTPTVTTFDSRLYTLNITDIYGCFDEDAIVNITIERESSLDMPDAFTPGTGVVNRAIGPDGWAIESIQLFQIFAKDGSLVHNAKGTKEEVKWDGTYNGKDLPIQTFTYKVIATTLLGETLEKTGTFDLLR